MPRIGTWRWRFGLAQEALSHSARVWRGAGTGSSPHGPPAPRRLPVPRGGPERAGELTPYEIQLLVADALRAGPGARLEMELAASTDDAGLATTRKRFAWLAGRGVAISVQRDHRAA